MISNFRSESLGIKFIIALICMIALVPVFGVTYYSTNDGPVHIEMAAHLANLFSEETTLSHKFFSFAPPLIPNVFIHYFAMIFRKIVDPDTVEKIVQSGCILLPILGGAWTVGISTIRGALAAALIAIMIHNQMFQLGLYNFILALGIWILLMGYIFRIRTKYTFKSALIIVTGFAVLYWIHGFVCAVGIAILVTAVTLKACFETYSQSVINRPLMTIFRKAKVLLIAAIIPAILVLGYMTGITVPTLDSEVVQTSIPQNAINIASAPSNNEMPLKAHLSGWTFYGRIIHALKASVLVVSQKSLLRIFVPVFIWFLFVIAVFYRIRLYIAEFKENDKASIFETDFLLLILLIIAGVYIIVPDDLGGGWTHVQRALLMTNLVMAIWISVSIPKSITLVSTFAAILMAGSVSAVTFTSQRHLSEQKSHIVALMNNIKHPAVLLPVVYSPKGVDKEGNHFATTVDPFGHLFNRPGKNGDLIVLGNFLARLRQYPVRFRDDANPYRFLFTDWVNRPLWHFDYKVLDVNNYENTIERCIDYLGVYGKKEHANPSLVNETQRLIANSFVLKACTDDKLFCLYRRSRATDFAPKHEACSW